MPASFVRRRLASLKAVVPGSGLPWLGRLRHGRVGAMPAPTESLVELADTAGCPSFAAQENRVLCSVANILSRTVAGVVSENEGRAELQEAPDRPTAGIRREQIDRLVGTVTETTHRLRQLAADLRPVALDDGDVTRALRVFLDRTRSDADPVWSVRSQDDGKGFSPPERRPRSRYAGLDAMRVRAELAGGSFRLQSTPGGGTTVEFWLPAAPAFATEHHGVT